MTYILTYIFRMKRWDKSRLFNRQRKSIPKPQPTLEPKADEAV